MSYLSLTGGWITRGAPFVLAALLLAVLVHIVTILILPAVAGRNGAQILLARANGATVHVIQPARPGDAATPFADPAAALAVCPFDLGEGLFRVRAQVGDAFTSLVVLGPAGEVVHGISDKAAVRRSIDVLIGTDTQIRAVEAQDGEERQTQEVRFRVPMARGLIVVRSLASRAADAAAVTDGLRRTQCGVAAES
jgi:uncharacterized membrane protein